MARKDLTANLTPEAGRENTARGNIWRAAAAWLCGAADWMLEFGFGLVMWAALRGASSDRPYHAWRASFLAS